MPKKSEDSLNEWIDPDDAPEITEEDLERAEWRINGKVVSRAEGQAEMVRLACVESGRRNALKERVDIPLDPDVLDYFRAGGPGWQNRINDALRAAAGLKP